MTNNQRQEEITVLYIESMIHEPEIKIMENELFPMQELIGGYLETVNLGNDIIMIVNEEGKLTNLPTSRIVQRQISIRGQRYTQVDNIAGAIVLVKADMKTGEFCSLSPEEIMKYMELFTPTVVNLKE